LFVPGISERMIRKSVELEADSIIFDLEDSVPYEEKENARQLLRRLLKEFVWNRKELCVRINPLSTREGLKDLIFVSELDVIDTVVVPKAEGDLSFVNTITGKNIEPLVETPKGFLGIEDLVRSDGVVAVSYGVADFSLRVGGDLKAYENNECVRTKIVIVARAYDVDPIDKVYFNLNDLNGFELECKVARSLGYVGKHVIHPSQIPIANKIFSASQKEIEWAKRVIEAYENAMKEGKGAIKLDGELIDNVHYKIAKRILQDYT